jgi:hypothetical protein
VLVILVATVHAQDECYACFPGFSGTSLAVNCSSCKLGSCTLPMNCTICPPGSFSSTNSSLFCEACGGEILFVCLFVFFFFFSFSFFSPVNTFSSVAGSSMCTPTRLGYFADFPFTSEKPCPGGTIKSETGCVACSRGQFSPVASSQCYDCPPGSFSFSPPSSTCSLCPVGTFNPLNAQDSLTACKSVQQGYFSMRGSANQRICPQAYKCSGKTLPTECLAFFDSAPGSASCSPTVWLFVFVPSTTITGLCCSYYLVFSLFSSC